MALSRLATNDPAHRGNRDAAVPRGDHRGRAPCTCHAAGSGDQRRRRTSCGCRAGSSSAGDAAPLFCGRLSRTSHRRARSAVERGGSGGFTAAKWLRHAAKMTAFRTAVRQLCFLRVGLLGQDRPTSAALAAVALLVLTAKIAYPVSVRAAYSNRHASTQEKGDGRETALVECNADAVAQSVSRHCVRAG